MAARLMSLPEAIEGILCDERTYNLCEPYFNFENLGEVKVKGKTDPIAVYRPIGMLSDSEISKRAQLDQNILIGRKTECRAIEDALQSMNELTAKCLCFEGAGGQGLNRLSQVVIECCEADDDIFYWYESV